MSRPIDLRAFRNQTWGRVGHRMRCALAEVGVSLPAMLACGVPGGAKARIETPGANTRDRRGVDHWSPDVRGNEHVTLAVYDGPIPGAYNAYAPHRPVDVIAFTMDQPSVWFSYTGDYPSMLGYDVADYARRLDAALPVFGSPLSWMRAYGYGVCVLDWDRARPHLVGMTELVAETLGLGEIVDARIREPIAPLPRVSIPRFVLNQSDHRTEA